MQQNLKEQLQLWRHIARHMYGLKLGPNGEIPQVDGEAGKIFRRECHIAWIYYQMGAIDMNDDIRAAGIDPRRFFKLANEEHEEIFKQLKSET